MDVHSIGLRRTIAFLRGGLVMGVALACLHCDIERGSGTYGPQTTADVLARDTTNGLSSDVGLGEGQGAGTMTGTWMLLHERSTCVTTLQTEEQITRALYRVRIEQNGASLEESRRLCDISLTSVLGQSIAIPRDVLESVTFLDVDRGVVSDVGPGGSYVSSTEAAFWGLRPERMDDPLSEPLPETTESGLAYDADDDGQPGVTFELMGGSCQRYNAQRQLIRYRGTFTTPNRIDGVSTAHTETVVFGASKSLCELAPDIRPNDRDSRFRMYRIDGRGGALEADTDGDGTIRCDEIRQLPTAEISSDREPSEERCQP